MYDKILVGTDGSTTAAEAVRHAAELARVHGSELIVMHGAKTAAGAPDVGFGVPAVDVEALRAAGNEMLAEVTSRYGADTNVRTVMREGDPADAIIDVAEEEGVDLVVVGNRGMRGAKRFLLGSVPNRVAHLAPCSVLIVHTT